jgi:Flp pilus assembly pilin Flp
LAGAILEHNSKFGGTKMKSIMNTLASLHREESGQGLIEYVLIIALIAFASVTTMKTLADDINNAFSTVGSELSSAIA